MENRFSKQSYAELGVSSLQIPALLIFSFSSWRTRHCKLFFGLKNSLFDVKQDIGSCFENMQSEKAPDIQQLTM